MNFLIIEEICLSRLLTPFDKSIFSTFSFISSIYARQLAAVTPKEYSVRVLEGGEEIDFTEEYDAIHINFKTATAPKAYQVADERSLLEVRLLAMDYRVQWQALRRRQSYRSLDL